MCNLASPSTAYEVRQLHVYGEVMDCMATKLNMWYVISLVPRLNPGKLGEGLGMRLVRNVILHVYVKWIKIMTVYPE